MSSKYERELRLVLAGLPKGVDAIIKSCSELQKARMKLIEQRPFLVVRAAGSGIEGSGDLLALRGDICFPIEVKSSKEAKLYLSGRTLEQYNSLVYEGNRSCLMPLYAYRLKGIRGDSWRIFRVGTKSLHGKLRKLAPSIPSLPLTRNGKPHLNWDKGMELNEFIALICSMPETSAGELAALQSRTKALSDDIDRDEFDQISYDSEPRRDILAELQQRRLRNL